MTDISFELIGLILCTTIFLSMLLIPFASSLANKIGAIDVPGDRSSHKTPRTRMGGLAMSLSMAIACISYLPRDGFLMAFLSGLAVIVLTGVIDDLVEIQPRWKFAGQIVAASAFVYLSGMKIEHTGDIVGLGDIGLGHASFVFTVFCLVGGINAFNLADGLDGLAGGLSVIAAVYFGYFAWHAQSGGLLILAVSLIGTTIGFLRFNDYPAKVFMGDSGSMMLGYVVGVMLITLSHSSAHLQIATLVMVVALPLLDTLVVIARRIHHGYSPFRADRTHLHHQLIDTGLSHPAVVAVLYGLMLAFGLLAFALKEEPSWMIFSTLVACGLMVFPGVIWAKKIGFGQRIPATRRMSIIGRTRAIDVIANWLGHTAGPVGILILAALALPSLTAPLLALNVNHLFVLYCAITLLVIYSWYTAAPDRSFLQGTLYVTVFALLLDYDLSALVHPSWLGDYLTAVSAAVLLWVLIKLLFEGQNEIIFPTGFELLMLFIAWFVPFVMMKDLPLSPRVLEAIQHTCLLSIPFMLAIKLIIRNHEKNVRWISIPLIAGLVMVAIRGAA